MLLHVECAKVDKNDVGLLSALEVLSLIIAQFNLDNVYNMDET